MPEINVSLFRVVGWDPSPWIPVPMEDRLINIPHLVGLAERGPKSCPQEEAIGHVYSGHVCPKEEGILGRHPSKRRPPHRGMGKVGRPQVGHGEVGVAEVRILAVR